MTPKRIVVATDGSEVAQLAVAWSADLARSLGAEVVAVHAMEIHTMYYPMGSAVAYIPVVDTDEVRRVLTEEMNTRWCEALQDAQLQFRAVLRDGVPAKVILDIAAEEAADLIVMGSRGHGGFTELLLGSVAHQVSHHAHVPVVIVPAHAVPAREEISVRSASSGA